MKKVQPKLLGVCGFKKSGKTTLIEKMLGELHLRGLRVGVIKRQNEPGQTDQPGTDTYRFYQAGASVLSWDGQTMFIKRRQGKPFSVEQALAYLGAQFDLVLVEGFKESDIDKIWLLREQETEPPPEVRNICKVLAWSDDRLKEAMILIHQYFLGKT